MSACVCGHYYLDHHHDNPENRVCNVPGCSCEHFRDTAPPATSLHFSMRELGRGHFAFRCPICGHVVHGPAPLSPCPCGYFPG